MSSLKSGACFNDKHLRAESHIHWIRKQSYPDGATNRAAGCCIHLSFFHLIVSISRVPIHRCTRRRQIREGLVRRFGLCGFAARHIELEHADAPARRARACSSQNPPSDQADSLLVRLLLSRYSEWPSPDEIAGRVFLDRIGSCLRRSVYFQNDRGGKDGTKGTRGSKLCEMTEVSLI